MFAPKNLTQQPIITENSELSSDEVARHLEILKRNDLIAGSDSIAQRVFDASRTHTFKKGHQIIGEGEEQDDVFFLLFGDVSIRKEGRGEIDVLCAPSTVGELAADMPEIPRTASVIVSSDSLRARVISGSQFRSIRDSNSDFANDLRRLIGNMNSRKIKQTAERSEPSLFMKAAKPLGIGVVSFILSASLFFNFTSVYWGQNLSLSALTAFVVVGLWMYFDHQHRYGRAFSMMLLATILYGSHFGVSYFFFVDGRSLPVPFLWKFNGSAEQSPIVAVSILAVLFMLCVLCAVADHFRNLPRE
jgi:CRP-like cAMP-binding protein